MVENKYYERKIKYLDLMENGERTGGAGFIKAEVRGMEISLIVTVRGLHHTDTYEREVMLQAGDGEFAIGRIALKEGQGEFKYHTVMDHSQLQGIRIALGGTREICSKWQEEKSISRMRENAEKKSVEKENAVKENFATAGETTEGAVQENGQQSHESPGAAAAERKEKKQQGGRKSQEIQLIPWDEIKAVEESLEKVEKIMSRPAESSSWKAAEREAENEVSERAAKRITERERKVRERKTTEIAEKSGGSEENLIKAGERRSNMEHETPGRDVEQRSERTARRTASGSSLRQGRRPVKLMEDKWQQIWAIYPHICPFQDEREYLSIGPADFVLLSDQAYRAANNSFLLHGYYNYDHLILAKIEKRGEVFYYIGVPGNYYEREKQVAVMFGFESFECGTEPAQAGDFGYYMMRTQL